MFTFNVIALLVIFFLVGFVFYARVDNYKYEIIFCVSGLLLCGIGLFIEKNLIKEGILIINYNDWKLALMYIPILIFVIIGTYLEKDKEFFKKDLFKLIIEKIKVCV